MDLRINFLYLSFCPWLCTPHRRFPPLFGSNTEIPQHCDNPEKQHTVKHALDEYKYINNVWLGWMTCVGTDL